MKVEQRIGRIDRVGQRFPVVRIVNLQYEDTIETAVYVVLQERIGFFKAVVGRLQPILSSLPQRIATAVLSDSAGQSSQTVTAGLEEEIAELSTSGFDLDSFTIADMDMSGRPAPLYGLGDLRDVLEKHRLFLPETSIEAASTSEFQITLPGGPKLRITVNPEYYDVHAEDVELWSPGNPTFQVPEDVADQSDLADVTLSDLLINRSL